MYSLRSHTSQSTISFPQRKRRLEERLKAQGAPEAEEQEAGASPCKTRRGMPATRRSARARRPARRAPRTGATASRSENEPPSTPNIKHSTKLGCEFRSPLKEPNSPAGATPERGRPTLPRARRVNGGVAKRLLFPALSSLDAAKQALHTSLPSTLLCREQQMSALSSFLHDHLLGAEPGALYVSGAPGTGKTACLTHTLNHSKDLVRQVQVAVVNCMAVRSPAAIFARLHAELLGGRPPSGRSLEEALVSFITHSDKMILIVLDELDQLDCRSQEVLYQLFEWPALHNSRLVLVGIANALDLTDRMLPRLQSHVRCQPALLHFPPYSKDEIASILEERLGGGAVTLDPMAIQFCARKVSAVHGDLRKALDICRRAIELVNVRQRAQSSAHSSAVGPVRVTLADIASVTSEAYGSGTTTSSPHTLPLQQKLVVCTLLMLARGRGKEVTVGGLRTAYVTVCERRQLRTEGEVEFVGLCDALEARGILTLKRSREARMTKVGLKLQPAELGRALQDHALLASVMDHTQLTTPTPL